MVGSRDMRARQGGGAKVMEEPMLTILVQGGLNMAMNVARKTIATKGLNHGAIYAFMY